MYETGVGRTRRVCTSKSNLNQTSRMYKEETEKIRQMLEKQNYVADPAIVMSVYLAKTLQKPLLVEGPAGVGKTEIAKVMAKALDTDLIRLQCYEGLDANMALYEWNYQRQLLHIKLEEGGGKSLAERESTIFSEDFLLKRPLLQAITHHKPPVLLIDELDRSDEEFESFFVRDSFGMANYNSGNRQYKSQRKTLCDFNQQPYPRNIGCSTPALFLLVDGLSGI